MNLWDYNMWRIIIQLGIILSSIIIGNIIRRKVKFIRNSLLPSSVIAGIVIFTLKFIPAVSKLIDSTFMEGLTYHCLGLGFIALTLKTTEKKKNVGAGVIVNAGLTTVLGYVVQAILGLGATMILAFTIFPDFFFAAGLLLPMGFGQGTGQALNIGKVFESLGFENGSAFGLSIAAIGFLVACIVGVLYLNYLKKRNRLEVQLARKEKANGLDENIYAEDEAPLSEAVDKLTIQIGLILACYVITYLIILGLSTLAVKYLGNFGVNTLNPLLWGFNFLIGTVVALIFRIVMNKLRKKSIMNHRYVNNYMMTRISGLFFDIMVVAGIAAINWQDLSGIFIPLVIVVVLGTIGTFFLVKFICKRIYPEYEYEAFFSIFGMLTGTASTGMILLREIDPNYETPAASNLVFQQIPAIVFGAPLLLLIPVAGQNLTNAIIVFAIIVAMFIVYSIILFRQKIFKRKKKN